LPALSDVFDLDLFFLESVWIAPGRPPASPGISEETTHARAPASGRHPARKHPEDFPGGPVVKSRSKPAGCAQGNDHLFLPLIAQAFSLLFQFRQLGRNHARTSQQIEGCSSPPSPLFSVTAYSKGVTGIFCGTADSKGLKNSFGASLLKLEVCFSATWADSQKWLSHREAARAQNKNASIRRHWNARSYS
jgi:hypothetical protein